MKSVLQKSKIDSCGCLKNSKNFPRTFHKRFCQTGSNSDFYLKISSAKSYLFLLFFLVILPQCVKSIPSSYSNLNEEEFEEAMMSTQPSACHSIEPPYLKTDDKIVLSPIVFQGQLMAKSNIYNSLYFVSFRVQKVWKGRLPRRLHRYVRLLFHTEHFSAAARRIHHEVDIEDDSTSNETEDQLPKSWKKIKRSLQKVCAPVRFNVQAGNKYLIYMKKIAHGHYVPVAVPDEYNRRSRKLAKRLTCSNCASAPKVTDLRPSVTVSEGGKFKLKCRFSGAPTPEVTWMKNGYPIRPGFRFNVKNKKRRSQLRVTDVNRRDMGKYTCSAKNVLGEHSSTTSVTVRYTVPEPPPSECPIDSFCLNNGKCFYYEVIGELVCKCKEGFTGQRCQFKRARINLPLIEGDACGPYGHDIHLREVCAAWKMPPVTEMTREEYDAWLTVEAQLADIRRQKEIEQMIKFRQMNVNDQSRPDTLAAGFSSRESHSNPSNDEDEEFE